MADFYREAIGVSLGSMAHPLVPPNHPSTLEEAAGILSMLTPRERCDAIYADWLMQLHNPGGSTQIQLRDLLLGQGAMDAHYLAELAQNADDAGATHLSISMENDWLLVANNGRPVNALNLLGLCRFFVHSNGQVVDLTPDTIGRFGIGFKASHRVAEQVVVSTWSTDKKDAFGFRLPISISNTAYSHPNPDVLERIEKSWRNLVGFRDPLRPGNQLGHCTPEHVEAPNTLLPGVLDERVHEFERTHPHGTWFAMKLHRAGAQDALQYMDDPEGSILEVNPMFLRNISELRFQNRVIVKKAGATKPNEAGNLRVTRLTFSHEQPGNSPRHERLLLIEPREADGVWKMAIPVNSNWMLYSPDPDLPLSSSGRLHAFLPLSGLIWPHACHLHLNLPPNLSRSSWNPDQEQEVQRAFADIAERFADWLLANTEQWHPNWQPSFILGKVESQGQPTASAVNFLKSFRAQLLEKDLVRSIWGNLVAAEKALELLLEDGEAPKSAWFRMADRLRASGSGLIPIVPTIGSVDILELPRMTTEAAVDLFLEIANSDSEKNQNFWDDYFWCAIGCVLHPSNAMSRVRYLEKVLVAVPIHREAGETTNLKSLAETDGRSRLQERWHRFFAEILAWLPQSLLSEHSLYGCPLKRLLRNLSQSSDSPTTWPEVAAAIESGNYDVLRGIWMQNMPACPHSLKKTIVNGLGVYKADGTRVPLAQTWVLSDYSGPLTRILFAPTTKDLVKSKIQAWDLRQAYIDSVKDWIPSNLKISLEALITTGMTPHLAESIFVAPDSIPLELKECVSVVLEEFVKSLLKSDNPQINGKIVLVGNVAGRDILGRLSTFAIAPNWLTTRVVSRFCAPRHIHEALSIEFAVEGSLSAAQKDRYGKLLLDGFPEWQITDEDERRTVGALAEYFSNATGNWTVRLPGNKNRRLNEFVAIDEDSKPEECVEINSLILLGQGAKLDEVRLLPAILQDFESLKEAALSPARLSFGSMDTVDFDECAEIPQTLSQNPWFTEVRKRAPKAKLVTVPEVDRLTYSYSEARISIPNPAFTYYSNETDDWIVIFGRGERETEEDGRKHAAILHHYSILAPEDRLVRTCLNKGRNFARFYQKYRTRIVNRLREVHATDLGYEARHVLRELLQNTETSYATCSRKDPDGKRSFRVHLEPLPGGADYQVTVTHHGRAFNEPLSNGQEIDDIMRICCVESNIPDVPGWRGRFNKGFKSLFQVTEGVKVTSGQYSFELRDLMLLDPMEPQPDFAMVDRPTTFDFIIPLRIRRDFLSEKGKPLKVGAFNAESLVFLQKVDQVEISEGDRTLLEYVISRKPAPDLRNWSLTTIANPNDKDGKAEHFLTCSGDFGGRRFGVAIKLMEGRKPDRIDAQKRRFYRTFPLEQPAEFASFLIEADFSTDQGRRGLREFETNGEIVLSAIRQVIALVKCIIESDGTKPGVWLNWVTWLDLRSLSRAAELFPVIGIELRKEIKALEEWLLARIPIGGSLRPVEEVTIPSPLLFRLMGDNQYAWILKRESATASWVSEEIATVIRQDFERSKVDTLLLSKHIETRIGEGADIAGLRVALATAQSQKVAKNAFEQLELTQAIWIIDPPVSRTIYPPETEIPPPIETITIDDLLEEWEEELALKEFSTAGSLGTLILSQGGGDEEIANHLRRVGTIEGKAAWYRLLCLGCSFSTLQGTSPRERVIALWKTRLGDAFWDKTIPESPTDASSADFNRHLDEFFERIIHRLFKDGRASGEDAEFWRRVFYDFRKMHYFVFRNHLPETILAYTSFQEVDGPGLINFLKSGEILDVVRDPSQPRFTGVIGQSMSSPLFFIMRELARLGVIDERFASACYYMNRPARRIASRLGWIHDDGFTVPTFDDLIRFSEQVHEQIQEEAPELLGYYDLPLQWYALSH